jgi:hypothetical protein
VTICPRTIDVQQRWGVAFMTGSEALVRPWAHSLNTTAAHKRLAAITLKIPRLLSVTINQGISCESTSSRNIYYVTKSRPLCI